MTDVTILSTGVANTASIAAALRRCGAEPEITNDPARVEQAPRVVLPGVGSFGAGMAVLRQRGLAAVLRARIENDRPTLAVCLGLQLLCAASEESPGVPGLGVIDAQIERFPDGVRTPHFGWNLVTPADRGVAVDAGFAYYANSYRLATPPEGWAHAATTHGGPFVAALRRGTILACQFHPELSGVWGAALLSRWVDATRGVPAC